MSDLAPGSRPFRLLLLLPNWLGDTVMATGLLDLLHQHRSLPHNRELHLIIGVRRPWASLFHNDHRVQEVFIVQRPGRHDGLPGLVRLSRDLSRENFDAVILGPPSLRVALAAWLAGIPLRAGYSSDARGILLTQKLPVLPRGQLHFVQEMLALGKTLLEALEVPTGTLAEFRPSLAGCQGIAPAPTGLSERWIFAPGATYGLAKTWPLDQAADFCRLVLERNVELVLLGDGGAAGLARALGSRLSVAVRTVASGEPGLVDLTGRTDLEQAVSLLKSGSVFVGNDSGLMHLAAALDVPTLGLFGSSSTAWTGPQGTNSRALAAEGFPCQPCFRRTCNQPQFCLETLDPERVFLEAGQLLAGKESAS